MIVVIRQFRPGDERVFRELNEAWIAAHFEIEPKDRDVLGDPQKYILEPGGHIYFACDSDSGEVTGCCALIAMEPGVYEVAKMAVGEKWRRRGIGRSLLRAAIDAAKALGAGRLYLETNQKLPNAIALYQSEGFEHLPPENVRKSQFTRANVFMERSL